MSASDIGYWCKTWVPGEPVPAGATMGLAFSGWADPTRALSDSAGALSGLVGTRFITLGGIGANGRWSATTLTSVRQTIQSGQLSGYGGVAFDIEEGASGLAAGFTEAAAAARAVGLKVLVTVTHSAPSGISDAPTLMAALLSDTNINYLSPQLYTTGTESANDYTETGGVAWTKWAATSIPILPSLVSATYYPSAVSYFQSKAITLQGYVVWNP